MDLCALEVVLTASLHRFLYKSLNSSPITGKQVNIIDVSFCSPAFCLILLSSIGRIDRPGRATLCSKEIVCAQTLLP